MSRVGSRPRRGRPTEGPTQFLGRSDHTTQVQAPSSLAKAGPRANGQAVPRKKTRAGAPRLDMTVYPYLPQVHVAMTLAKTYLGLLTRAAS
jgi:hypothetical protein